MSGTKIAALLLIAAGILGLAYGGFSFTKESHSSDIGPLHLELKEKERVNIPMWVGIGAIVGGVLILTVGGRRI
jgi:drug/metabolite transporter (DMT)-like permease